jgi:hypothetical protein
MRETKTANKIWVGKAYGKRSVGRYSLDMRIILKRMLSK